MIAKPLLIENLSHSYHKKSPLVLDQVNIELHEGEILGLVGLNGIGKTTIIKSILGLIYPNGGCITIAGNDNKSTDARRLFTYLPEKFSPPMNLRGREYLELTLSFYGQSYDHERAQQVCQDLDLDPNALDQYTKQYSKGMGQKLGLVATFLTDVSVLILDEPMSGLDPKARVALKRKICDYVAQNKERAVFFSSHIMADIEEICDRIVVLHASKIRYSGDVKTFVHKNGGIDLERALLTLIERSS